MEVADDVIRALARRESEDAIKCHMEKILRAWQVDAATVLRRRERAATELDRKRRQSRSPLRCGHCSSSSRFHSLPEILTVDVANYLEPREILALAAAGKHWRACTSSVEVWKWRPLNLGHVRTVGQWDEAVGRGFRTVHWNCSTVVTAPSAKAMRVVYEFLCFFGDRVKHLDLSAILYETFNDYLIFLAERQLDGAVLESLVLPAANACDARVGRLTRRTLARLLLMRSRYVQGLSQIVEYK